jgi:hypothetical protein
MSRYSITTLALAAGLATSGAAYGQAVLPGTAQPQTPAGALVGAGGSTLFIQEDGGSEFADGNVTVRIDMLDGGGAVITGAFFDATSATSVNGTPTGGGGQFAAGQDDLTIDLSATPFNTVAGASGAVGFRVTVTDSATDFDTVDYTISAAAPVLVQAILDDVSTPPLLFLIYDRALTNGSGDNDTNQTTTAGIGSLDDFEVSLDGSFTSPQLLNASVVSNETILPVGNVIRYDLDVPAAVDFGTAVRYTGSGDIKSVTGVESTAAAIDFEAETALSLSAAFAIEEIGSGATGDFRLTFNQAIGDPGDAQFYADNLSWTLGGNAITPDAISAVAFDPDNADSVILTVNLPGGAQVDADGLDDSDDAYAVTLTSGGAGNPPETVLGTAYAGTDEAADVTDGITPTLVGPLGVWDADGDGAIDAFGLIFNEPMGPLGNTPGVFDAFEFETIANSTVHPYSLFLSNLANGLTDPNDAANEVDIATDGTTTFNASALALLSEDSTERLTSDNIVAVIFDPTAVDWNGDGTVDADDAGLFPGGFDTGWATLAMVAADAGLADAAGNGYDTDLGATTANSDFAPPILAEVWHRNAENDWDFQFWFETDGTVGDNAADAAIMIFNETMSSTNGGPGNFPNSYSFGPSASERFQPGNFQGFGNGALSNNAVSFRDFNNRGWDLGDTLTIAGENGLDDLAGNEYGGGSAGASIDRTSPFVPRQFDINGSQIYGAYVNPAADGSVESISLIFTKAVEFIDDTGAPLTDLTDVAGDFEIDGDTVDSVSVAGNVVTLVPANAGNLLASSTFDVYYDGEVDTRRLAEAGVPANVVDSDGDITAQPIAEPEIDGEFTAVMDVFGQITNNGNPAPAGTQVFGMLGVQRVSEIIVSMNSIEGVIDADNDPDDSLNAFTNFILGLREDLYLIDDDGEMWFTNDKDDNSGSSYALMSVSATVSRGSVRWQARGVTYTQGDSQQQRVNAQGTATLVWDVLRSDNGDVVDLYEDGFDIYGEPISSKAVITNNTGEYLLHMTGPYKPFNGAVAGKGAPIILVVERTNGQRMMATSIHNGADGLGTLQFNPLQAQREPTEGRFDGAVDIELTNIGMETAYPGWNLTPFNRDSGFATTSAGIPQSIPAGVTPFVLNDPDNTILQGTTLTNAPAYLQWGFYVDNNDDGMWTRSDDFNGLLSSTVVDPRAYWPNFLAFTLTDRGVQANNSIAGLIGGYAMGLYNDDWFGDMGIFQFGAERASGTSLFSAAYRSSTTNMGWALVTSPGDAAAADSFLGANDADFLIEFNRTDSDEVEISTFDGAASEGDTSSVNRGQGYFIHVEQ